MKIGTKYFGDFEVKEEEILRFPKGIFGFESCTGYTIIPFDEEDETSFLCLQSLDDRDLAFILFSPFYVDPAYTPSLAKEDAAELAIGEKTPVTFLAITVVYDNFKDSTVNMKCPIVINNDTRTAKQVILDADYSLRQRIVRPESEG